MKNSKSLFYVFLIIAVVLIIVLIMVNQHKGNNKQNTQSQSSTNNVGTITAKDTTNKTQGDIELSNIQITNSNGITNVSAEATNKGNLKYSTVDISVIFYDSNKAVLATAKGLIENMEAGSTKGFSSSISGDFSNSSTYEVKIEKAQ